MYYFVQCILASTNSSILIPKLCSVLIHLLFFALIYSLADFCRFFFSRFFFKFSTLRWITNIFTWHTINHPSHAHIHLHNKPHAPAENNMQHPNLHRNILWSMLLNTNSRLVRLSCWRYHGVPTVMPVHQNENKRKLEKVQKHNDHDVYKCT